MQVNSVSLSQKSPTPAFGNIQYVAAEKVLRSRLSLDELKEFSKLVKENEHFKNANLILFGEKDNKIWARVADSAVYTPYELLKSIKRSDYTPRFFESTMHFIKRMIPKMQARNQEVAEIIEKANFKIEG